MSDFNNKGKAEDHHHKKQEDQEEQELKKLLEQISETPGVSSKALKSSKKKKSAMEKEAELKRLSDIKEESEKLEDLLEKMSQLEEKKQAKTLNIFQRIFGIFYHPTRIFQDIQNRSNLKIPFIITLLVAIFFFSQTYDLYLNKTIRTIEGSKLLAKEQQGYFIDKLELVQSGAQPVAVVLFILALPVLSVSVIWLSAGSFFWLVGKLFLDGKAEFLQVLAVLGYSGLIYALPGSLVTLYLMLQQQTVDIQLNLAVLIEPYIPGINPYLASFLRCINVFTIWLLIVFGTGLAMINHCSKSKAFILVFTPWLAWVSFYVFMLVPFMEGLNA